MAFAKCATTIDISSSALRAAVGENAPLTL
jgi:hypothetical protein